QPVGVRLDEAAHERPVLVQGRTPVRTVLLERKRKVDAVPGGERAEAEPAQRVVEVRRKHRNSPKTPPARVPLSDSSGTSTRSARRRPAGRNGRACRNGGTVGRPGGRRG